jgi:predicted transposase/invertase (TIGR01784 family)
MELKSNNKYQLLDPKLDFTFKLLFGGEDCEDLLISLCTAVLQPVHPIISCEVLNPNMPRDFTSTKPIVLDLLVQLADRTMVNIEMQQVKWYNVITRGFYYWAKTHNRQLEKGDHYDLNTQTVVVFFLNYHEERNKYDGLQNIMQVVDGNGDLVRDSPFRFDLIEIPRIIDSLKELRPGQEPGLLEKWLMFFHDPDDNQLEAIMETDPNIKKAKTRLKTLSEDEQNQIEAEMRQKAITAWNMDRMGLEKAAREARKDGLQEGMEKGMEQGVEKGRMDTLRFMIHRLSGSGHSMAEIGNICNLTKEEIETLLQKDKQSES